MRTVVEWYSVSWIEALVELAEHEPKNILAAAAVQIRELASALAPIETGALKNSIALVWEGGDDFGARMRIALTYRPDIRGFQKPPPIEKNTVYLVPVVGYAGHQEFGTIHHPAQSFLFPAVTTIAPRAIPKGFKVEIFGKYKKKPPIRRHVIMK